MKRIITLLPALTGFVMFSMAQINFNAVDVENWIGMGSHQIMFIVDFDSDPYGADSAFAWGIQFESDSVTGEDILELIAQSNENFTFETSGGFLNNIEYTVNNQTYTNPDIGWFSIIESFEGENWMWNSGIADYVGNEQWLGIVVMNPDTYEAEINVPLLGTGISINLNENIRIFPNPVSDILNIELPCDASILLMNTSGQLIRQVNGKSETIDLTNTPPGLYIISIAGDEIFISQKILVQ